MKCKEWLKISLQDEKQFHYFVQRLLQGRQHWSEFEGKKLKTSISLISRLEKALQQKEKSPYCS